MGPSKEVQGQALILVIPNQKGVRKLETRVWRVVARYLRILVEFRIQSSLQTNHLKDNEQDWNLISIRLCYNFLLKYNFSSIITLLSIKDNHSKTIFFFFCKDKSSVIKPGLIIYVSTTARLVINHIGCF